MIILDYQDRRPLYEQIVEKIRTLILRGALPPGTRLPSVRQLALELSINPNTIQRAYMELEQEGLIYPVKGRGNFVADSQKLQRKAREDYERELRDTVDRGRRLGITEEEIFRIVKGCFEMERPEDKTVAESAYGQRETPEGKDLFPESTCGKEET